MLNLGFKEEMERIFNLLPTKRQTLLFSATLSNDVNKINQALLHNPEVINIEDTVDDLKYIEQNQYVHNNNRPRNF